MHTRLKKLYTALIEAMAVEGLHIPTTAVKFYRKEEHIPQVVMENHPSDITLTCCQAAKQASLGDAVCLTLENIGCVAAAVSLGLVDQHQDTPLGDSRVYTNIMRDQSGDDHRFIPPSPKDFQEGIVYACKDSGRPEFCLFGKTDSGRFKDVKTAKKAVREMTAIQPAIMKAVFLYAPDFDAVDLPPDVVVLSVRPVELARIIQAYQYETGRRITASMGAVRVVNSDLIVRPFLTGKINISTFCIGARLIAGYEADRLGIGIPFKIYEQIVAAMAASKTGYPFPQYPGAA